jgi:hypothetical protein
MPIESVDVGLGRLVTTMRSVTGATLTTADHCSPTLRRRCSRSWAYDGRPK